MGYGGVGGGEFLDLLYVGECEPLKAGGRPADGDGGALRAIQHGRMAERREPHLGFNVLVYTPRPSGNTCTSSSTWPADQSVDASTKTTRCATPPDE
jgi:hypothetical protein